MDVQKANTFKTFYKHDFHKIISVVCNKNLLQI